MFPEEEYYVINEDDIPVREEDFRLTVSEWEYIQKNAKECGAHHVDVALTEDGEGLEIQYYTHKKQPFDRIRRITGYLTGTLDTWNRAKRAEERDRRKHLEADDEY